MGTKQTTKKRVSFSFKFRAENGEPSLLSSIQAIAKMNLDVEDDVEDNVDTENDLNQITEEEEEETILEESMRLFWTSNNRIKEERQRRKSMLEVKSRGKRDSFTLPSQYLQNIPKLLNLGGTLFDSDDSEDDDEQEILKLYETIQSNNIHNCRRHSYYE